MHDSPGCKTGVGINFTLHCITLHHITSHYITSHHITSHRITSHHITSHHITSHHITSHHITSHHITLHYITLHYITLHFIALHLIIFHHITSHHITLYYAASLCSLRAVERQNGDGSISLRQREMLEAAIISCCPRAPRDNIDNSVFAVAQQPHCGNGDSTTWKNQWDVETWL